MSVYIIFPNPIFFIQARLYKLINPHSLRLWHQTDRRKKKSLDTLNFNREPKKEKKQKKEPLHSWCCACLVVRYMYIRALPAAAASARRGRSTPLERPSSSPSPLASCSPTCSSCWPWSPGVAAVAAAGHCPGRPCRRRQSTWWRWGTSPSWGSPAS